MIQSNSSYDIYQPIDESYIEKETIEIDYVNEARDITKKRNMIEKSLDNIRYALKSKFNKAYAIIKKIENEDDIYDELKKVLPSLKKTDTGYSYKYMDFETYNKKVIEAKKILKYDKYFNNDQKCYSMVRQTLNYQTKLSNEKLIKEQIAIMDNIVKNSNKIPDIKDFIIIKTIKKGELKNFALSYITSTKGNISKFKVGAFTGKSKISIEISGTNRELNRVNLMEQTKDIKLCKEYLNSWITSFKVLEEKEIKKYEFMRDFLENKDNIAESSYEMIEEGLFKKNQLSDAEIKKFYNLIKKEFDLVIDKDYNNNDKNKKVARRIMDDYIRDYTHDYDTATLKNRFGRYYKDNVPVLKCNGYINHNNKLTISVIPANIKDELVIESLRPTVDDLELRHLKMSKLFKSISIDYLSRIIIKYDPIQVREYLNSDSIKESYIEETSTIIEEVSLFGLKINKKNLEDEEYVKELLNKIEQLDDTKNTINIIISVLGFISMLTIIGVPIGLLLFEITKKIDKNREKISKKNLEKINSYIDKSITKLKKSASKASGEEKEELEKIINNLEKNKKIVKVKTDKEIIKFENDDKFTKSVALDFKKHLESKLKSTSITVGLTDSDLIYFEYDEYEGTAAEESAYYNEKSKQIAKAIMSYNKNVLCQKNENNFKIDKRIEYNNAIIDLSYKEDRFNCFILPVVEKSMIPDSYTYSQVKTLLKDINIFQINLYDSKIVIDVITDNVDSYIKKVSGIFKNATVSKKEKKVKIGQGDVITIEFNNQIDESYTSERGEEEMSNIVNEGLFKKKKYTNPTKEEYNKAISITKKILNKYTDIKPAFKILKYEIIEDTLYFLDYNTWHIKWSSKNRRTDHEYETKFQDPFEEFCNELEKEFKSYNLVFTVDGDFDSGSFYMKKIVSNNESYIIKTINTLAECARLNNLEPTRNRLRLDIVSEYTDIINSLSSVEESVIKNDISLLPVYQINEGYAIDLSSLKYVIESKKITLEEAIKEIKEVNNIKEASIMYCILPENINENMSVESFITLNNTLNEAGIIPTMNMVLEVENFALKPEL